MPKRDKKLERQQIERAKKTLKEDIVRKTQETRKKSARLKLLRKFPKYK